LDVDRLKRFAVFLAKWEPGAVNTRVPRPRPDPGENLVLQTIIRPLHALIGSGDVEALHRQIRLHQGNNPRLYERFDAIWSRYGSDDAFNAYLSNIVSVVTCPA
jgi:hypothetical protein